MLLSGGWDFYVLARVHSPAWSLLIFDLLPAPADNINGVERTFANFFLNTVELCRTLCQPAVVKLWVLHLWSKCSALFKITAYDDEIRIKQAAWWCKLVLNVMSCNQFCLPDYILLQLLVKFLIMMLVEFDLIWVFGCFCLAPSFCTFQVAKESITNNGPTKFYLIPTLVKQVRYHHTHLQLRIKQSNRRGN